jgi:tetratricopeptide (TPR) repeat protein
VNTLSAEREVARLVARAKRDKEEAKDHRDNGDIAAAVSVLEETVRALDASPLAAGLETANASSKPMRELAAQLADCLGMLGGNYRRQGRLKEAQVAFERGRVYEESPSLEVMSSYNLVNAITLPIESNAQAWDTQRPFIERAVSALSRQVRSERRSDRWAWADLAQCQMLLGDEAGALQSYGRVRDLGDDDTVASVTSVLERLGNAAPALKSRVTAAITYLKA